MSSTKGESSPFAPKRPGASAGAMIAALGLTLGAVAVVIQRTPPAAAPTTARFTRITGVPATTDRASTGGVTWVDFDGDGDNDLFVTNGYDVSKSPVPQKDRLYRNDGRGNLTPVEDSPLVNDSAYSSGSSWGDFDNDGDLDALVPAQLNQNELLYRNEGGGRFTRISEGPLVSSGGRSFAAGWVDIDGDGKLDVTVFNGGLSGPELLFVFRNMGEGAFTRIVDAPLATDSGQFGGGHWADYDNDGDVDLFVARHAARVGGRIQAASAYYRNDGNWRFTRIDAGAAMNDTLNGYAAAAGDYDDDGDLDVAVSGSPYATRLYRNDGNGSFTRVLDAGPLVLEGGETTGVNWGDADNDGDLDVITVRWGAAATLYINVGNGKFERQDVGDLGKIIGHASSVTWGDMDGDGDLDLYLGNWPNSPGPNEENYLYRNDGRNGNWLLLALEGRQSNRSAIGARVTARATIAGRSKVQTREVAAHTSWRSQNALDVHIGLGDAREASEITVRWPSGHVDRLTRVRANQRLKVVEGSGR